MSTTQVTPTNGDVAVDDVTSEALIIHLQRTGALTRAGLVLDDPDLPIDTLCELATALGEHRDMTAWALGDLVLFTEAVHGELVGQLVESTRRSKSTLLNYVRVAKAIPYSRRVVRDRDRPGLTWSHHEAVASLDPQEQDRLLAEAEQKAWDVEELRDARKALRPSADDGQEVIDDVDRVDVLAAAKTVVSRAKRVERGYLIGVRAYEALRDAVDREGVDA